MKKLGTNARLKKKLQEVLDLNVAENAAMDNANNPSASNPFATLADLPEGGGIIDVTYAELVALMDSSGDGLVPGQFYRITDFATAHYMMDNLVAIMEDINTGSIEPLIVRAISESALDIHAYSELYPYDIIHYDWNPANWLTDISFGGNDETLVTGFKGVIYFRHDTLRDNYMCYDFRNVKFRRWNDGSIVGASFSSEYQGVTSVSPGVTDPEDYIDVLTFNCPDGEQQYNNSVYFVHLEKINIDASLLYGYDMSLLLNNVFHLLPSALAPCVQIAVFSFSFCIYNTFNSGVYGNEASSMVAFNKFASGFGFNQIENIIESIINGPFIGNKVGAVRGCIMNSVSYSTFGTNVTLIVTQGDCSNLSVGYNSKQITIGSEDTSVCTSIYIGADCEDIFIGSHSHVITIGDYCENIIIGESTIDISFGSSCDDITLPNNAYRNTFLSGCKSKDFTDSLTINVADGSNIIHRMCATKLVGTYLEEQSDGSFVEVHAEDIIGVSV